ncbi:MAG: DUF692 domain-containing protein [Halieaceae bacterium]|nr:DUF692 domain-containing protein [Halieaceae bacterium]
MPDSTGYTTGNPTPGFQGAGLGLRRALLGPLSDMAQGSVDFMEVAPENWIGVGGRFGRQFRELAERYTISLHGLSLNIGGVEPLDRDLVTAIGAFMDSFNCPLYTEHLTYCADDGHLYDLMPIPFTAEAVQHVAGRVREVQDLLGRRIALENASYYAVSAAEMTESEFIRAVLEEADCDLLLDVNNIYVNSINHRYDAAAFLASLPLERARYIHIAGHYDEAEDLKVDTHGADVIDPVWSLLEQAYQLCGPLPTLLERDFNLPPLADLLDEVAQIRRLQDACRDKVLRHG